MQQHQNKIKCHVTRHSLYCCKSQKYLAVVDSSSEQHAEQGTMLTFLPLKISVIIKNFRSQWHSLSYDEWTETWFQKFQALQLRSLPSKDPISYCRNICYCWNQSKKGWSKNKIPSLKRSHLLCAPVWTKCKYTNHSNWLFEKHIMCCKDCIPVF